MNVLQAAVLGIVEGLTEFLPVSSTGHLILTSKLLGLQQNGFVKTFEIAIQLGAILAVVALYWKKLVLDRDALKRIVVAFIPTAIIGFILYSLIKGLFFESYGIVLFALYGGGIFLIITEIWYDDKKGRVEDFSKMTLGKAAIIGLFQSLSIIPGVSRAAASIIGGMVAGLNRSSAVEFSFLLAVPTMFAATSLDFAKNVRIFSINQFALLLVGFVVSFAVALFAVKFFLGYIKKHNFLGFGVYRIILAVLYFLLVF